MEIETKFNGFACFCDESGKISKILNTSFEYTDVLLPGRLLFPVINDPDRHFFLNFLIETKRKKIASIEAVTFKFNNTSFCQGVFGYCVDEGLLLIVSNNQQAAFDYLTNFQLITAEQSNAIRSLEKSQFFANREKANDRLLLNEISLLNNELVNLQRELLRKNEELRRLNDSKNQFVGMAAHDLRNPISVICHYAEFLLEEKLMPKPDERKTFLETIYKTASFSLAIIEDLLDISKIESGKLELRLSEFDIVNLLSENIHINRLFAQRKNIDVRFQTNHNLLMVTADQDKIQQVMNNLITNAIKFSHTGKTVTVDLKDGKGFLLITISDQGQGIVPEKLEEIFLPFKKGLDKGTYDEKGTGLGLAIVKRIIEGHNGKIWAESEVGRGADFFVQLPISS